MRSTRIGFLCTRALFHLACRHSFAASHGTSTLPAGVHLLPRMTRWQERRPRPRRLACHFTLCIRAPSLIFRAPFYSGMETSPLPGKQQAAQGEGKSPRLTCSDTARRVAARKASAPQQAARKAERCEAPQGIEDDISCDGYAMCTVKKCNAICWHIPACEQHFLLLNKSC